MANGLRSPWHFQAGPTTRKCLPRLQSNSSQAADSDDSDIERWRRCKNQWNKLNGNFRSAEKREPEAAPRPRPAPARESSRKKQHTARYDPVAEQSPSTSADDEQTAESFSKALLKTEL